MGTISDLCSDITFSELRTATLPRLCRWKTERRTASDRCIDSVLAVKLFFSLRRAFCDETNQWASWIAERTSVADFRYSGCVCCTAVSLVNVIWTRSRIQTLFSVELCNVSVALHITDLQSVADIYQASSETCHWNSWCMLCSKPSNKPKNKEYLAFKNKIVQDEQGRGLCSRGTCEKCGANYIRTKSGVATGLWSRTRSRFGAFRGCLWNAMCPKVFIWFTLISTVVTPEHAGATPPPRLLRATRSWSLHMSSHGQGGTKSLSVI